MEGKCQWKSTEHPPTVSVYHSIGGWKAQLLVWVTYDDEFAMYEPWTTGMGGYKTRDEAVREATSWAKDEGYNLDV